MKLLKIVSVGLILIFGSKANAQTENDQLEIKLITETLTHYIEGTANGEPDRLRKAFHPDFNLYSVTAEDSLRIWAGKDYIGNIKIGEKNSREGRIISIDFEKDAAIAKAEIVIPDWRIFTDYFLLLKYEGTWKIVHKSYTWREYAKKEKTPSSQESDYLDKVQTLDSTIETLYAVISGEAGEKRDWDLFKYLFTADAQLLPSGPNKEGEIGYRAMTPAGYIESSGEWLETNGFFEKEIYRVTETFGSVTHIFSTYESYRSEADEQSFTRGINSIQLMNDGSRWWVMNIYWMGETADNPIPKKYLPK